MASFKSNTIECIGVAWQGAAHIFYLQTTRALQGQDMSTFVAGNGSTAQTQITWLFDKRGIEPHHILAYTDTSRAIYSYRINLKRPPFGPRPSRRASYARHMRAMCVSCARPIKTSSSYSTPPCRDRPRRRPRRDTHGCPDGCPTPAPWRWGNST